MGEIFFQKSRFASLRFDHGRPEEARNSFSGGCGARVVNKGHTFFSHASETGFSGTRNCLNESLRRAGLDLFPGEKGKAPQYDIIPDPGQVACIDSDSLRSLDTLIRSESPGIRQVSFSFKASESEIAISSDMPQICRDRIHRTRFSAEVVMEYGGELFTGYEVRAFRLPSKAFLEKIDLESVARSALERAILQTRAVPCPAGAMPVILSGRAGGTMIHEACGHGLEADIVQKDFSVFRNSLGTMVASPMVTLIDDATLPDLFGSYSFDGEGTPAQRTILIREGKLESFLTDRVSSMESGRPLTGNGRRSSYMAPPVPRMSNTFIMNGDDDAATFPGSTPQGLYVAKMGGGEVNPTSGDFVFHVAEGYLFKNGEIGKPVKNAILTGSGPEVLLSIKGVGSDLQFEPGLCGKAGQSVPVTDGQPTLMIEKLLVGGSKTDNGSR